MSLQSKILLQNLNHILVGQFKSHIGTTQARDVFRCTLGFMVYFFFGYEGFEPRRNKTGLQEFSAVSVEKATFAKHATITESNIFAFMVNLELFLVVVKPFDEIAVFPTRKCHPFLFIYPT